MTDETVVLTKDDVAAIVLLVRLGGAWAESAYMPHVDDEEPFHAVALALEAELSGEPSAEAWRIARHNIAVYRAWEAYDDARMAAIHRMTETSDASNPTLPAKGYTQEERDDAHRAYKALRRPEGAVYIRTVKDDTEAVE